MTEIGAVFEWMDMHNGLIAALAGVMVAIFTGVLWCSTDKLWKAGEKAAELNAKALANSIKANVIAERSIFEQNRPWVFVKDIHFEQEKAWITVSFTNAGKTPARAFKKTITGHVLPVPFPSSALPEPDEGYSSFLPPGDTEILTLDKPGPMKAGYEYCIRIALSYEMQNGEVDSRHGRSPRSALPAFVRDRSAGPRRRRCPWPSSRRTGEACRSRYWGRSERSARPARRG
jgi:hypothetical protein